MKKALMRNKKTMLAWAVLLPLQAARAQESPGPGGAIQGAFGLGFHEGRDEGGLGLLCALGYQKSLGATSRWRLNPQLVYGEFSSAGITDRRDQFYRTTSAGAALHFDVVKYRAVALTVSGGAYVTYSRGLLGTGGELQAPGAGSRYFRRVTPSAGGGVGLRVSPAKGRLAYEFQPLTFQGGPNGFFLGYALLGLAFDLKK